MEKVTELQEPPVVGRFYLVSCLPHQIEEKTIMVPVFPHVHQDRELGTPRNHVHYDWRFIADDLKHHLYDGTKTIPVKNIRGKSTEITYHWIPTICLRMWEGADPNGFQESGDWPSVTGLDEICRGLVRKGNVCPHKGFPLDSAIKRPDGSVVCPLHGAIWDKNGCYLPRKNNNQQRIESLLRQHPEKESFPVTVHVFEEPFHYPQQKSVALNVEIYRNGIQLPAFSIEVLEKCRIIGYAVLHENKIIWMERIHQPIIFEAVGGTFNITP